MGRYNSPIQTLSLSPEAFTDALAKGRGLAALALLDGDPARYTDALLAACVENHQWDRQCEANRGPYMMRLLDLAGLRDAARERILQALPATEDDWDRDWMVDLLGELATAGDTVAWDALRSLAAAGNERAQDGLATTSETGLQWAFDNVLPKLPEDERYRVSFWLPDEEADDNTPLQKRLRALYQEWDKARDAAPKTRRPKRPTAAEFLRQVDANASVYVSPLDFAEKATPRQWRRLARSFVRETRARPLRNLTRPFRNHPFPLPARRLFRQADHPERGGYVLILLGALDTPAVRRFALGLLRRRPLPWNGMEALRSSLRKGDEPLVLSALVSVADKDRATRHDPILDVVGFMRRLPDGQWQPHAEWIFEHSPCSVCRDSAVDWMAERGTIPDAFLNEIPYDAEPDIRDAPPPKPLPV